MDLLEELYLAGFLPVEFEDQFERLRQAAAA
jgi:hypothetical protein